MPDWRSLLELAPFAVGALKPGSPEAAAMMRGYLESQARMRQEGRLDAREDIARQQLERQNELTQAQIGHYETQDAMAAQRAALQRLGAFDVYGRERGEQIGEFAEDPLGAQNQLTMDLLGRAQTLGLPPSVSAGTLPNMAARVAKGVKADAAALLERPLTHLPKAMRDQQIVDDASISFEWAAQSPRLQRALMERGHGLDPNTQQPLPIKPSELHGLLSAGLNPRTGQTWTPTRAAEEAAEGKSDLDRSIQRERRARERRLERRLTPQEVADLDREIRTEIKALPNPPPIQRFSRAEVTNERGELVEANYDATTGTYTDVNTGERLRNLTPKPSAGGLGGAAIQLRTQRTAAALNSLERLKQLAPVRRPGPAGIAQGVGQVLKGYAGYNTKARQYQALIQPTAMQMAAAIQGAANLSDNERKAMADTLGSIHTMDYESQLALLDQAGQLLESNAEVEKRDGRWYPRGRVPATTPVRGRAVRDPVTGQLRLEGR